MRPDAEFRPALDPPCDAGEHHREAEWKKGGVGQLHGEGALTADQGARPHPILRAGTAHGHCRRPSGDAEYASRRRYPGTSVRGGDSSVKKAVPRAAGLTVGVVLALAAGATPGRAAPVTP